MAMRQAKSSFVVPAIAVGGSSTEPWNHYRAFPTDYRVEVWTPPYLFSLDQRQSRSRPRTLRGGEALEIQFMTTESLDSLEVDRYIYLCQ